MSCLQKSSSRLLSVYSLLPTNSSLTSRTDWGANFSRGHYCSNQDWTTRLLWCIFLLATIWPLSRPTSADEFSGLHCLSRRDIDPAHFDSLKRTSLRIKCSNPLFITDCLVSSYFLVNSKEKKDQTAWSITCDQKITKILILPRDCLDWQRKTLYSLATPLGVALSFWYRDLKLNPLFGTHKFEIIQIPIVLQSFTEKCFCYISGITYFCLYFQCDKRKTGITVTPWSAKCWTELFCRSKCNVLLAFLTVYDIFYHNILRSDEGIERTRRPAPSYLHGGPQNKSSGTPFRPSFKMPRPSELLLTYFPYHHSRRL